MQLTHRPSKLLITGRSGTGKSTYFTRYVLNSRYHYRFVFDHEGEFQERTRYRAAVTPEDLVNHLHARRLVIFDPAAMFPGRTPEAFAFFCEWCFVVCEHLPGTKLFACDELQKLTGTMSVSWEFACILETGRRRGIDLVTISQAPNLIHNRVRNCLTECVTFVHNDANAVQFLLDVGFNEQEVRGLRPGEFICRDLIACRNDYGRVF